MCVCYVRVCTWRHDNGHDHYGNLLTKAGSKPHGLLSQHSAYSHTYSHEQAINTKRAQIVSAATTEEPVTQHATTCVPKLHDTTAAKFATHNSKECSIIVQHHYTGPNSLSLSSR